MGAAGPEEQNKEAEVCKPQRHQTLEGWGRTHLDGTSTELRIRRAAVNAFTRRQGDLYRVIKR